MKHTWRWIVGVLILIPLLAIAAAALSNVGLPTHSRVIVHLSAAEKARLAEMFHLRRALGDAVWPGWAQAVLLDHFAPGWKAEAWTPDTWLEDLLVEALLQGKPAEPPSASLAVGAARERPRCPSLVTRPGSRPYTQTGSIPPVLLMTRAPLSPILQPDTFDTEGRMEHL